MLFHVAGLYSGKIVFSVSQVRITLYPSSICILFHDLYSSYPPCGVIVFSQIGAHLYSRSPGLPGGPLLLNMRKLVLCRRGQRGMRDAPLICSCIPWQLLAQTGT